MFYLGADNLYLLYILADIEHTFFAAVEGYFNIQGFFHVLLLVLDNYLGFVYFLPEGVAAEFSEDQLAVVEMWEEAGLLFADIGIEAIWIFTVEL